jgi:uncharacterized protein
MNAKEDLKFHAVATKEDILLCIDGIHAQLIKLGVKRLGLFGSFVRGEQREDSDVDLLVEFCPGAKTFSNFMNTAFLLEDTLGRRVELVTVEGLSPYIGPHILKEMEYVSIAA